MDGPAPVLRPGDTCWRLARARRFAVIIDADEYFGHLRTAILAARRSIFLIGWDFDPRVALVRGRARDGAPVEVGPLLEWAVRRRPGLRVHVLRWDLAFLKMPIRGTTAALLLDWLSSRRLRFRMDGHHPTGACHHQKIAVIDDALAFCGGIDVTGGRWDTPAHADHAPGRTWPGGEPHGPWHDATAAMDGAAARALGALARTRWRLATGGRAPRPRPRRWSGRRRDVWPPALAPTLRDVAVGIARTEPPYGGAPGAREIEALYLAAFASARRTIYLESQYFSAHRLADALAARLAEPDGPEVIVVNPIRADGWLEETAMGSARALLLERLRAADAGGRLRFVTPVTAGGADIYVHAKVVVVDDTLLRIGSSNINNRSLGLDTECDVAVALDARDPAQAGRRAAVTAVRDRLLAEHLGLPPAAWRAALRAADGSVARALDTAMGTRAKTLVPFTPPELTGTERALAETALLDPDRPEPAAEVLARALTVLRPSRARLAWRAAALAALGVAAWRLRVAARGRAGRTR